MFNEEHTHFTPAGEVFSDISNRLKAGGIDLRPLWAWNATKADWVIKNQEVDIVLVDLDRTIDGLELIASLRRKLPSATIIGFLDQLDEEVSQCVA